ncbi:hypothetical protein Pcinc_026407 [Petrolisthes cinctipes]|uniref:Uncharacterized protein n=1 Tax=Petrolisthes cinctipes TaxID=88211 RepID=A0AAE1F7G0_PETCI|nr:hypothetical protein Pcinc_026407 [Petrolisthes cinctipes]
MPEFYNKYDALHASPPSCVSHHHHIQSSVECGLDPHLPPPTHTLHPSIVPTQSFYPLSPCTAQSIQPHSFITPTTVLSIHPLSSLFISPTVPTHQSVNLPSHSYHIIPPIVTNRSLHPPQSLAPFPKPTQTPRCYSVSRYFLSLSRSPSHPESDTHKA